MAAGQRLRQTRESLGFTLQEVEEMSRGIAAFLKEEECIILASRLSDIESKNVSPTIYRLHTLSLAYKVDILKLLSWFGIEANLVVPDAILKTPKKTHLLREAGLPQRSTVPIEAEPAFDPQRTTDLARLITRWGALPASFLKQMSDKDYLYGYLGMQDAGMYPLLVPGSFLQVDPARRSVAEGVWRTEYERPIYFIETRDGFHCCWCSLGNRLLTLQFHPLSGRRPLTLRHQQDAEVLGQVVGVAMRLDHVAMAVTGPATSARQV